MEYDHNRAEVKKKEMIDSVISVFKADGVFVDHSTDELIKASNDIIENFALVYPPEKEEMRLEFIMMRDGGRGGGESTKPGNVRFNMKKLCIAISNGVFTSVAITKVPWLAFFGALRLWDDFYACAKVKLTEDTASVLYSMWIHKDDQDCIAKSAVKKAVDLERTKRKQAQLTTGQVMSCIKMLEKLRCIKQSKISSSKWWLCEWVMFRYK